MILACTPGLPPEIAAFVLTFVGMGLLSLVASCFLDVERPDDPHRCGRCDYELRGLVENRCPECGTPFFSDLVPPPFAGK